MRGMILAAGFGERMRPLSQLRPKPCLPVAGRPLIHYAIDLLRSAGVTDVAVNLHHMGDAVREAVGDGSRLGVGVAYSVEDEILGTGGGIKRAREFLAADGDEPFLVSNSDTLFDADLAPAIERHRESGALATMVLTTSADPNRYGAVRYTGDGRVADIAGLLGVSALKESAAVFAGVHVFSPRIFDLMPGDDVFCIVRDVIVPAVANGEKVMAVAADGVWLDAGEPADYLEANRRVLKEAVCEFHGASGTFRKLLEPLFPFPRDVFVGPMASVAPGVTFHGPVLVQPRARIGDEASIGPDVVVGAGSRIGPKAKLSDVVVWDGGIVNAGAELSRCVVAPGGVYPVP